MPSHEEGTLFHRQQVVREYLALLRLRLRQVARLVAELGEDLPPRASLALLFELVAHVDQVVPQLEALVHPGASIDDSACRP